MLQNRLKFNAVYQKKWQMQCYENIHLQKNKTCKHVPTNQSAQKISQPYNKYYYCLVFNAFSEFCTGNINTHIVSRHL